MVYKLFIEDGEYQDIDTKEPRNMMEVEIAYTPDGINIGWDEFNSKDEAMSHYNIQVKPEVLNEEE
jgi:hypothetical protein